MCYKSLTKTCLPNRIYIFKNLILIISRSQVFQIAFWLFKNIFGVFSKPSLHKYDSQICWNEGYNWEKHFKQPVLSKCCLNMILIISCIQFFVPLKNIFSIVLLSQAYQNTFKSLRNAFYKFLTFKSVSLVF